MRQLSLSWTGSEPGDALLLPSAEQTPVGALGTVVLWRVRRGLSPDPRQLKAFRNEWIRRRRKAELPGRAQIDAGPAERATSSSPSGRLTLRRGQSAASNPIVLTFVHHAIPADDDLLEDPEAAQVSQDNEDLDRELESFALRLERHWLVEWSEPQPQRKGRGKDTSDPESFSPESSDAERRYRRPPVMMLDYRGLTIIGADLLPQVRLALGALTAFELITADELRATFRHFQQPVPAPSELSRTLRYLEESGFLLPAPPEVAERYRKDRREVGRRPLRVYLSAAFSLARDRGALLGYRALDPVRTGVAALDSGGRPAEAAREELSDWSHMREVSQGAGLWTV